MNIICKVPKKKKTKTEDANNKRLNKKMLVILNALNITELAQLTEEQATTIKNCIAWSKKTTLKLRKEADFVASSTEVDFFNFYNCVVFFCLLYPEETETCLELQMVHKDLVALMSASD